MRGNQRPKLVAFALAVTSVMATADCTFAQQLQPRPKFTKPARTTLKLSHHLADVIIVKFADDLTVREFNGRLHDRGTGALNPAQALIGRMPGTWRAMHALPEQSLTQLRQTAQANLGKQVADLSTVFYYTAPAGTDTAALCDRFNAMPIVEYARPAPRPVDPPGIPNYEDQQQYIDPATDGVNAECMWQVPGGTGANVAICDLEYSWNFDHVDFPTITLLGGTPDDPFNSFDHGTAVLGEMASQPNGFGTTGIVYDSTFYVAAARTEGNNYNLAGAITTALGTLGQGDFILIEQQTQGPNYIDNTSQFGLVPSEWDVDVYNAVVTAVGNGVCVVAAAGNGSQDLDGAEYNAGHAPFLLANDSGAYIVGAGGHLTSGSGDRARLSFSCFGATVDLQGIGSSVTTTGYGDLLSIFGVDLEYTGSFSGTSSSSPIVTGAAASVQSAYFQATGMYLSCADLKDVLIATGSPQLDGTNPATEHIGPRPNAAAAFATLMPSIDCDANLIPDVCDLDCDGSGTPDSCDIAGDPTLDCDGNGAIDSCEILDDPTLDCDSNGILDICELAGDPGLDCNNNGIIDSCDIVSGFSEDCNNNSIPDECDLASGKSEDCNNNMIPDECDIASGFSEDCNNNLVPDECDVLSGFSEDCNNDNIPDECQLGNCLNQVELVNLAFFSDADCDFCATGQSRVAESFEAGPAVQMINGLRFWGTYDAFGGAYADQFTVRFYNDGGGVPAGLPFATIAAGEADLKIAAISPLAGSVFEYEIHFAVPVQTPPGTIWVSIQNDTSDASQMTSWAWHGATFDPVNGSVNSASAINVAGDNWAVTAAFDPALQIFCATAPDNDCNANGVPDDCEEDCNMNNIPDPCETKPEGDPNVATAHDDCFDADLVGPGILYVDTTNGSTPSFGGVFQCSPLLFGDNDVYYLYRPAWDGPCFIGLQGPPTQFPYAVYDGCPEAGGTFVACNASNHFAINFFAEKNHEYYIRIAAQGFGTFGDFQMELTGPDASLNPIDVDGNGVPDECDCFADVDNDGMVAVADYILVLNLQGTTCLGCPEDVNHDGMINVEDLQDILTNIGLCPF